MRVGDVEGTGELFLTLFVEAHDKMSASKKVRVNVRATFRVYILFATNFCAIDFCVVGRFFILLKLGSRIEKNGVVFYNTVVFVFDVKLVVALLQKK